MKKALILCLFLAASAVSKAQHTDESRVKAMLKTFYTAYMTSFSKDTGDELLELRKKYCTSKCERLYKKLVEETDGDPFIKGQDSDASYAKTLTIKRDSKTPNSYTVSYYYEEYNEKGKLQKETVTINLIIIKIKGKLKIDAVS
ncbi:hypothetical protein ACFQZI_09710 [Mucilaginibacter lutimaris]|uniref:DUF3828 domain-containing protein n=1 Tax=Mucilaginibacter lutimaris TaxID=931629 RepID=A0ABW2ZFY2_9SPHI